MDIWSTFLPRSQSSLSLTTMTIPLQFTAASFVYYFLSVVFPANETMLQSPVLEDEFVHQSDQNIDKLTVEADVEKSVNDD